MKLTAHPFRSARQDNRQYLGFEAASDWFRGLLLGAASHKTHVHVGIRADRLTEILEISVFSVDATSKSRYYELSGLMVAEREVLFKEYKDYRAAA